MKKSLFFPAMAALFLFFNTTVAQDKKAPASPPASAKATLASGATIIINYSRPSVKGRTIGKDLEPMAGKVWRTGANQATTFETDKNITVEGKSLPAGKYGLFTIAGDKEWTIIFNKTWDQWGAFNYDQAKDALRVNVKTGKAPSFTETFTINANKNGKISLLWGNIQTDFNVK